MPRSFDPNACGTVDAIIMDAMDQAKTGVPRCANKAKGLDDAVLPVKVMGIKDHGTGDLYFGFANKVTPRQCAAACGAG